MARDARMELLWRTALALGGSPARADDLVSVVIRGLFNPWRTGESRLLRLLTRASMASDCWNGANSTALGEPLGPVVRSLDPAVRAAWLLVIVRAVPEMDAARAVESPGGRDLAALVAAGNERIDEALGAAAPGAINEARGRIDASDAAAGIERVRSRTRGVRRLRVAVSAAQVVIFLACAGMLVYVLLDLQHAAKVERENKNEFSLPYEAPRKKP